MRRCQTEVPVDDDAGWPRSTPEEAGFDGVRLARAIAFARRHETAWPADIRAVIEGGGFDPPPWNCVLGPTKPRGGPCGLVLAGGREVARWGDVTRPDMIFSVTKSYLGVLAGIAVDRGLIGDPRDPVRLSCPHDALERAQNRDVTWLDLLRQTSELEVTLWGIPDDVDRNRQLSPQEDPARRGRPHRLRRSGTYWDYNDIRVNFLCLCLTILFRRSLETVLAETVMTPLGAARDWEWWGLRESRVAIGGQDVACVVGGGHWGGGLVTSACHDARLGLLILRGGRWRGETVISPGWLGTMLSPGPLNPVYGALWWLNTGGLLHRAASHGAVFALGVGMNAIWVDAARDLVVVTRWMAADAYDEFVTLLMASHGS